MKQVLTTIALLIILVGCSTSKQSSEGSNEVVIIVDGLAYSDRFYFEYGKEEGAYSMRTNHAPFTYLSIDPEEDITAIRESGDTTSVTLDAEWMFVKYNFNPHASSDFIAHKGDTVRIRRDTSKIYSRAQPQISILNRDAKPLDTEYRKAYLDRFGSYEGLTIEEVENHHTLLWDIYDFDFTQGFKAWNEYGMRHNGAIVETLEKENVWIDSLNTAGMFSEPAYRYFKERNIWSLKKRKVFGYKGSVAEAVADSIFRADYDKDRFDSDVYGFYKGFMNSVAYSSYFPKYIQVSQGSTCDWEYTYAKLQNDTLIKGTPFFETFLIRTLDGMVQDFPKHKSKKYVDMTVASVDSTFANTLKERYHDAFAEEMMVENEVLLMSPDGMKTSLSKVLNSLKGKVVYVDFWASWCRPCSAEMEPAAELRERMKGNDIEFIYLSTDEDHSKMCASLDKLKLTGCNVYRILNPKAAKFIYEYNIQLIPRYMIIDKNGKIVNDNAPRPSSEEIGHILLKVS